DHARDYGCYHYYSETLRLRGDLILARDPQPDRPAPHTVAAARSAYQLAWDDAVSRNSQAWQRRIEQSLALCDTLSTGPSAARTESD
ncbi:MAG: hypothetical protein ACKOFW_21305, partial [Planctomycetaceae bacterium]